MKLNCLRVCSVIMSIIFLTSGVGYAMPFSRQDAVRHTLSVPQAKPRTSSELSIVTKLSRNAVYDGMSDMFGQGNEKNLGMLTEASKFQIECEVFFAAKDCFGLKKHIFASLVQLRDEAESVPVVLHALELLAKLYLERKDYDSLKALIREVLNNGELAGSMATSFLVLLTHDFQAHTSYIREAIKDVREKTSGKENKIRLRIAELFVSQEFRVTENGIMYNDEPLVMSTDPESGSRFYDIEPAVYIYENIALSEDADADAIIKSLIWRQFGIALFSAHNADTSEAIFALEESLYSYEYWNYETVMYLISAYEERKDSETAFVLLQEIETEGYGDEIVSNRELIFLIQSKLAQYYKKYGKFAEAIQYYKKAWNGVNLKVRAEITNSAKNMQALHTVNLANGTRFHTALESLSSALLKMPFKYLSSDESKILYAMRFFVDFVSAECELFAQRECNEKEWQDAIEHIQFVLKIVTVYRIKYLLGQKKNVTDSTDIRALYQILISKFVRDAAQAGKRNNPKSERTHYQTVLGLYYDICRLDIRLNVSMIMMITTAFYYCNGPDEAIKFLFEYVNVYGDILSRGGLTEDELVDRQNDFVVLTEQLAQLFYARDNGEEDRNRAEYYFMQTLRAAEAVGLDNATLKLEVLYYRALIYYHRKDMLQATNMFKKAEEIFDPGLHEHISDARMAFVNMLLSLRDGLKVDANIVKKFIESPFKQHAIADYIDAADRSDRLLCIAFFATCAQSILNKFAMTNDDKSKLEYLEMLVKKFTDVCDFDIATGDLICVSPLSYQGNTNHVKKTIQKINGCLDSVNYKIKNVLESRREAEEARIAGEKRVSELRKRIEPAMKIVNYNQRKNELLNIALAYPEDYLPLVTLYRFCCEVSERNLVHALRHKDDTIFTPRDLQDALDTVLEKMRKHTKYVPDDTPVLKLPTGEITVLNVLPVDAQISVPTEDGANIIERSVQPLTRKEKFASIYEGLLQKESSEGSSVALLNEYIDLLKTGFGAHQNGPQWDVPASLYDILGNALEDASDVRDEIEKKYAGENMPEDIALGMRQLDSLAIHYMIKQELCYSGGDFDGMVGNAQSETKNLGKTNMREFFAWSALFMLTNIYGDDASTWQEVEMIKWSILRHVERVSNNDIQLLVDEVINKKMWTTGNKEKLENFMNRLGLSAHYLTEKAMRYKEILVSIENMYNHAGDDRSLTSSNIFTIQETLRKLENNGDKADMYTLNTIIRVALRHDDLQGAEKLQDLNPKSNDQFKKESKQLIQAYIMKQQASLYQAA